MKDLTAPQALVIAATITGMFALIQAVGILWVQSSIASTTEAIIVMERQINSNMERQMRQAVDEAIANYRLGVELRKEAEP